MKRILFAAAPSAGSGEADVVIEPHGSVILFRPLTPEARRWIYSWVDDPIWFGNALVVEPRYADELEAAMAHDDLASVVAW